MSAAPAKSPQPKHRHVTMSAEVKSAPVAAAEKSKIRAVEYQGGVPVSADAYRPFVPPANDVRGSLLQSSVSYNRGRDSAVDPLRESLAHSLLTSQELFRSQIESLRLRLDMTNATGISAQPWRSSLDGFGGGRLSTAASMQFPGLRRSLDESSGADGGVGVSSYTPAPSLMQLKSQFDAKRLSNTQRMYELLVRAYPGMEDEEALELAEKY